MTEVNLKRLALNGFIWKFGEQLLVQIISFIISLIVARILLPSDYGVVAIVSIFISIFNVLINNGLPTSLIQKKDSSELDFNSIFYCNLVFSLILYALIYVAADHLALFYNQPQLTMIFRIMGLSLPISSVNSIQRAYVSKHMQFKKLFLSTFLGTIVSGAAGIYSALKGFGPWSLVLQSLLNLIIDTSVLFFTVPWKPKRMFSIDTAKPLVRYGWKNMATDGIATISNQVSSLVIGIMYLPQDLAYYTKGKSIPELIDNNVFGALAAVLFPAMSKVKDNQNVLKEMTRKSMQISTFILFPILFGLMGVSRPLVLLLLTEKWAPCIPYICASCIVGVFSIMPTIDQQLIKGLGRSDLTMKLEFIKKPVLILCVFIFSHFGVFWIALSIVFAALWESIVNSVVVEKLVEYSVVDQIVDVLPQLAISVIMLIVVLIVGQLKISPIILLLCQTSVGIIIYVFLSVVFKLEPFIYALTYIRTWRK